MKTLKLQRVTRYFGYILLATVLFSSCGLRARQGEDIHNTNDEEAIVIKSRITYIKDERTGLCFAVLNNSTDGYRSTFTITCVPCDSLKRVSLK